MYASGGRMLVNSEHMHSEGGKVEEAKSGQ